MTPAQRRADALLLTWVAEGWQARVNRPSGVLGAADRYLVEEYLTCQGREPSYGLMSALKIWAGLQPSLLAAAAELRTLAQVVASAGWRSAERDALARHVIAIASDVVRHGRTGAAELAPNAFAMA